jgi:hypothetical protein
MADAAGAERVAVERAEVVDGIAVVGGMVDDRDRRRVVTLSEVDSDDVALFHRLVRVVPDVLDRVEHPHPGQSGEALCRVGERPSSSTAGPTSRIHVVSAAPVIAK